MEPISTIATAISSIKTATEIAQLFRTSEESFVNAELKLKLADMISALADAKISLAELKESLLDKDTEIRKLKEEIELINSGKNKLVLRDGFYYDGDDGPFCTNCYDAKQLKIRITNVTGNFRSFGKFKCPNCKNYFK